jgi:3-hydroxyacyl-CoA dehydrogenase/enoyl-CoA hydratase/3-hydroxybutyryl-CoA epimerase
MIYYKKDTDNIVTLTLDMQGRPMNVINHEIFEAFVPVVEQLKVDKKWGTLRGVILTSGKKPFWRVVTLSICTKPTTPLRYLLFVKK